MPASSETGAPEKLFSAMTRATSSSAVPWLKYVTSRVIIRAAVMERAKVSIACRQAWTYSSVTGRDINVSRHLFHRRINIIFSKSDIQGRVNFKSDWSAIAKRPFMVIAANAQKKPPGALHGSG